MPRFIRAVTGAALSENRLHVSYALRTPPRRESHRPPSLVWICVDDLSRSLDASTYLLTTRELRRRAWRVTLIAAGPPETELIDGVPVHCVPRSRAYLVGHLLWHAKVLAELRRLPRAPDLILFHPDSAPYLLPLRWLRRLFGRPRPLLVMDTRTLAMTTTGLRAKVRASFYRVAAWCANRWADGQTVITARMARVLQVPPEQLLGSWPSGVDTARFAEAAGSRVWPSAGEPVEFVYIGVLRPERRLLELAGAAVLAHREAHCLRLTFLGDGPQRAALETLAESTGGVVRVRPPVAHADVPRALARAHVGVLPFPDLEIFRVSSFLKLYEYLAAGLPVVATPIVSHTEVLGGSDCVFWAQDAGPEALARALGQACAARAELARLGAQASNLARPFDWSASARALQRCLEPLLHRTSPPTFPAAPSD